MTTAVSRPPTDRPRLAHATLAKVPAVTGLFWAVKVLTTGMGESASDYLAVENVWVLGLLGTVGLVLALRRQLRATRYDAVTYWSAVALVALSGTVLADGLRQVLGLSLPLVTGLYAVLLAAVLAAWRRSEGTLSIHTITTRRRETFYWTTVMLTFALGTAAGDLTAFYLGWGFTVSIAVFAVGMVLSWGAHKAGLLGEVAAFWTAYVLTRPLGASVADWLGKPSGVGLGDGTVTAVALVLILGLVGYLAVRKSDVQAPTVGLEERDGTAAQAA